MRSIRLALSLALILCLAGGAMAQQTGGGSATKPVPPDTFILQGLGKLKLEDIKKGAPGGTEAVVNPPARSRMAQLKVDKSYTETDGKAVYYFSKGLLVSAAAKAAKPLTKEQLLKEIKDLKFQKLPPNQVEAAFVRRSATVIQGFYLSSDGKYVELTTFDYVPQ